LARELHRLPRARTVRKENLTMKINSLFSGSSDPASLTKLLEPSAATSAKSADKPGSSSATTQPSAEVIRSIVSGYDLKNITPLQLSEMLQALHEAGALSDQQLQELSTIRTDLDLQGIESDEPVDLLDYCSKRLDDLQKRLQDANDGFAGQPPQGESLETVSRWLAWLQKIATVQSLPEAPGVNAVV
jgi:hypothetical protein